MICGENRWRLYVFMEEWYRFRPLAISVPFRWINRCVVCAAAGQIYLTVLLVALRCALDASFMFFRKRNMIMSSTGKTAVVDNILSRAAEQVGDITRPAVDIYYDRFPQARALFEKHAVGAKQNLEGEMVERALYCLMYWFDSPGEVEILLMGSVPHHSDTLKVAPELYQGFLVATTEVIAATIPPENIEELSVWQELCNELEKLIVQSGQYSVK